MAVVMNYYDTIRACLPAFLPTKTRMSNEPTRLDAFQFSPRLRPSTRSCRELCSCHRYFPRFSTINLILRTHVNEMWIGSIMRAISSVAHLLSPIERKKSEALFYRFFRNLNHDRSATVCTYLNLNFFLS